MVVKTGTGQLMVSDSGKHWLARSLRLDHPSNTVALFELSDQAKLATDKPLPLGDEAPPAGAFCKAGPARQSAFILALSATGTTSQCIKGKLQSPKAEGGASMAQAGECGTRDGRRCFPHLSLTP